MRGWGYQKLTWNCAINFMWAGWAMTVGFLQLLHLFVPIQVIVQVGIVALAVAGLWGAGSCLGWLYQDIKKQFGSGLKLLIPLLTLITLAILAASADWHYDSGNYHQQSVLWASQSSVVPGLGNLHVRLAFNSSLHLYFGLLNVGWLKGSASHVGNSFLLAMTLLTLFTKCLLQKEKMRAGNFAAWLVLPGIVALANPLNMATLITDLGVVVVEVIACFLLIELFESEHLQQFRERYFTVLLLSVVGITIKLSVVLFSAVAILIATALLVRRQASLLKSRSLWLVYGGLCLILCGWIIHGILLSGYPLFPSPAFPLPVEWRVPLRTAVEKTGWTRAWPRLIQDNSMKKHYQDIMSNWDWFRPWLSGLTRNLWGFKFPMAILITGFGLAGLLIFRKTHRGRFVSGLKISAPIIAINCLALAGWFFLAPDIRFAWGLVWVTASLVLATALAALQGNKRALAFQFVAILSLAMTAKSLHGSVKWLKAHWTPPENATDIVEFKTRTGLILNVPKVGEQCFKAALPCTPYPSPLLSRREKGGFKVEPFSEDAIVGWYTKEMPWEQMKP